MKKILIASFIAFLTLQNFAQAADKQEEVKKFVEEIGNKIVRIAGEAGVSESKKREKIVSVIDAAIDSDWIAKFVLAKNYKTANETQKTRFLKLYREFEYRNRGRHINRIFRIFRIFA